MSSWIALRAELAKSTYSGLSDADALAAGIAPDAGNPQPKSFTFADVMGCLSADSIANIRNCPTGRDLIDKINAQDRPGITHWLAALQAGTALITPTEAQKVAAVLTATVPGPGPLTVAFGAEPTIDDIKAARS